MSKKFAEMSVSEFCNYVAANPGGAAKAYELRKKYGGDMGGGGERVVYKDRVVEKRVEVPVEKRVEVPVEKVVYKDRVVETKVESEDNLLSTIGWLCISPFVLAVSFFLSERIPAILRLGAFLILIGSIGNFSGSDEGKAKSPVVQDVSYEAPVTQVLSPEPSEIITPIMREPQSDCEIWRESHPQLSDKLNPGDQCFIF